MKKFSKIICFVFGMIALVIIIPDQLLSQSKAKIEHVDFFPDGNTLIITYDIVKYKAGETFKVWLNVYSEKGNKIIPDALKGDVGSNIPGGPNKRILWDMEADNAFLDEDIAVVVLAESEMYSAKGKSTTGEQPVGQKQFSQKKGISVGGAIGLSLALPGLGRRIATKKGAGFLWGIGGYACVGGAYLMNNSAYNSYEDYKKASTAQERDDLYKKAKNQDIYSKVLVGAAVTIWVVDLIVTGVKVSKMRRSYQDQRMSFYATYDPYIQQPLMGVRVRF